MLGRVQAEPRLRAVLRFARSLDTTSARSVGDPVLTIYPVILQTIAELRPLMERIERHDRDLGRQMRRAASSVALNVAEGMYSRGKNRAARYHTALGSARETMACVEVAVALGYLQQADPPMMDRLGRIVGTLVRLVQRHA